MHGRNNLRVSSNTEGDLGLCYSLSTADKNNYDTGEKIEEDSIQTFASKWTQDKTKSEELPELAMNIINLDNGRGCNQNTVGASYENYAIKIPDTNIALITPERIANNPPNRVNITVVIHPNPLE